jgi:hypothetical protein
MDKRKVLFLVFGVVAVFVAIGYFSWDFLRNKSGSCVVLPEEYCVLAEETYVDSQFIGVTANLQSGVKVYAPFNGILKYAGKITINNEEADIWIVENSPTAALSSETTDAVFFVNLTRKLSQGKTVAVKTGEFLGRTTSPMAENKGYNILMDFKRYNPNFGYALTDASLLHQFFPEK